MCAITVYSAHHKKNSNFKEVTINITYIWNHIQTGGNGSYTGENGFELLMFLMPNRIDIPQVHRITVVALHLGVFQGIVIFLREALW